jgi:hypothetical protein
MRDLTPWLTVAGLARLIHWSPLAAAVLVGSLAVLAGIGWFLIRCERRRRP